jgi:cytochrome c5
MSKLPLSSLVITSTGSISFDKGAPEAVLTAASLQDLAALSALGVQLTDIVTDYTGGIDAAAAAGSAANLTSLFTDYAGGELSMLLADYTASASTAGVLTDLLKQYQGTATGQLNSLLTEYKSTTGRLRTLLTAYAAGGLATTTSVTAASTAAAAANTKATQLSAAGTAGTFNTTINTTCDVALATPTLTIPSGQSTDYQTSNPNGINNLLLGQTGIGQLLIDSTYLYVWNGTKWNKIAYTPYV